MVEYYKYLNERGAYLTLKSGQFRHAKPSSFDDQSDMTFDRLFNETTEEALKFIQENFLKVLLENTESKPTIQDPTLRIKLHVIQQALKNNKEVISLIESELKQDSISNIYDLEQINKITKEFVFDINNSLQNYRIFCLTDTKTSIQMWENYADNHQGVVVRITPNIEMDSKFQLLKKVRYFDRRPPMYDSLRGFLLEALFGNKQQLVAKRIDKIIYSKTKEWEYEREYRLAVALADGEDFETMPYGEGEISEMYIGANCNQGLKRLLIRMAFARNPEIKIYQAHLSEDKEIVFSKCIS